MAKLKSKYRMIAINPKHFEYTQIKFYLVLLPFLLIAFLPIVYIICTAFKPLEELFAYPPRFFTSRPTAENFVKLFEASQNTSFPLSMYLFNSIVVTLAVVVFGILISASAAYSLSKVRFKGRSIIFKFNTLSMMFVATAVSIPRYLIIKQVGLLDTFTANIIPMLATPVVVFLLKQFVDQIPNALIEAAKIDGANDITVLFRIILPLSMPIIAVMILFYGVAQWNSWFNAMLYIRDRAKYPLQLILREVLLMNDTSGMGASASAGDQYMIGESIKYATIMVATVPILFVYPFIQKYFVKGIMIGAVKG